MLYSHIQCNMRGMAIQDLVPVRKDGNDLY